jgi:16S rRNA (uracil1498-N3)-methyltransferase
MSRRLHVPRARIDQASLAGEAGNVPLLEDERHYLRDVLRLAPGDPLEVFDGEGGLHDARLGPAGDALALGPRRAAPAPAARIHLAFALAKGEKNDLVVQKATELGVACLLPFAGARSVVKLDAERGAERARRWRRIAEEAARQCGRADVPEVRAPARLSHVLSGVAPAASGACLLAFDAAGAPLAEALDPAAPLHLAVTGPEGGLTPEELAACAAAGARLVRLGPRILRAETAAIAVVALLQHRLGDLG